MLDQPISHVSQTYLEHRVCSPEDNCDVHPERPICFKPVQMPYDPEGAMEAHLTPGEIARLFGWIYVKNDSQIDLEIQMGFNLHKGGLLIEVEATLPSGEIVRLQQYLPMNAVYSLQIQDGALVLIKQGVAEDMEAQPTLMGAGNRNLNRMSQKG